MPEIDIFEEENRPKKWYRKWWVILLFFLGGLILLFVGQIFYYYLQIKSGKMPLPASSKFSKTVLATTPSSEFDPERILPAGEPNSSPNASLNIIGFFDFQCPYSLEAYAVLKEIQIIYGDTVNFVFRNFPIAEIHPDAVVAARAGECAYLQDKFWSMADKIFTNQNFTEDDLKTYAREIGLDEEKFNTCLNSYQGNGQVLRDLLDGQTLGIGGTPTWFINNEKVEGTIPLDIFKKIIEYFLFKK